MSKIGGMWFLIIMLASTSLIVDIRTNFLYNFFGRSGGIIVFLSVIFPFVALRREIHNSNSDGISRAIQVTLKAYGLRSNQEKSISIFEKYRVWSVIFSAGVGTIINCYGEFIKFIFIK